MNLKSKSFLYDLLKFEIWNSNLIYTKFFDWLIKDMENIKKGNQLITCPSNYVNEIMYMYCRKWKLA